MQDLGGTPSAPFGAERGAATLLDPEARELADLIVRLIRRMRAPGGAFPVELQTRLDASGLARRHVATLITIALHEPLTVGQLAEHLALSLATASQLVNQLDRGGLVVRKEDPADRRRIILTLHPHDRELIMPLAQRRIAAIEKALHAMAPVDRERFLAGWRSLVQALEQAP